MALGAGGCDRAAQAEAHRPPDPSASGSGVRLRPGVVLHGLRLRPGQTPADRSRGTGGPSAPGRHGPAGPSHEHDRHHGPGSSAPPGDGAGGGRGHGHRQACRALHLPTIRRRIQEMAADAMRQRSSYKDFLAHLLEAECAEREERRKQRLVRDANFP
ncbi:ATP-binding protein [Streptomyces sp. NPDC058255]|uniref:ATP-binding protein n=1 Tax=Streptomyces sp. NPDC058255 TaxID=3346407 RepID=UPI0036E40997